MSRRVGALVGLVAALGCGLGWGAPAARASTSGLVVRLMVDRPVVTVDHDAPLDQPLGYQIVVTNDGDAVVPGVVVDADVPGGAVHRVVGDVAPGDEWRTVVEVTIPASTIGGGPVESVAVARSSDGREVASEPARVEVQVISSAVYDRDPAPATEVLGETIERPAPTVVPRALARTGAPIAPLTAFAAAFVVVGLCVSRALPSSTARIPAPMRRIRRSARP